jgi:hypothetical protein
MNEYLGSQFFRGFILDFLGKKLVAEGDILSIDDIPQMIESMSQMGFVVSIDHLDPDSNEVIGTISRE